MAVVWAKVSPSNRLIITDELYDSSIKNMDALAARMKEIETKRGHNVVWSTMDSWGNQKDVNGKSMIDVFKQHGIECTAAPKADKRARVYATAEMFKLDEFTQQPNIAIFKNCNRLIWEIKRYVHPSLRRKSRTELYKDIPEGTDKRDDDLIDAVLFMVAGKPDYNRFMAMRTRRSFEMPVYSEDRVVFAEEYGGK